MKRLIYILFAWLLAAACEDKETDLVVKTSYDVSEVEVVIPASGDLDDYILVTATTEWNISGANEWCRVSPASGAEGTTRVYFELDENVDYSGRSVQFTLNVAGEKTIITVYQKQKDALTISKDKFDFGQKGGNVELKLNTNIVDQVQYKIVTPGYAEPWITKSRVPASKAREDYDLVFAVAENPDGAKREGVIIVEDELRRFSDTIRVYQVQKDMIVLSANEYKVPFEGQDLRVELKANIDYGVEISEEGKGWISLPPASKSLQPDMRIFKIAEYPEELERQADIFFYDKNNPALREKITIKQLRIGTIIVLEKWVKDIPQAGGVATYEIQANVDYEIIVPERVDWIRPKPRTRALDKSTVILEVDPNPETQIEREAKVFLRSTNADTEEVVIDTLYVHQLGRPRLSEYKILMALAKALEKTPGFYNSGLSKWGDKENPGDGKVTSAWPYIKLNEAGNVISIDITLNKLKGTLPKELGELKYLEIFEVNGSVDLGGELPAELGYLKNLKKMDIQGEFTYIPDELGDLENLEILYLRCVATHEPTFIGGLTNLKDLKLLCHYEGALPAGIGNLKKLEKLTIGQIVGTANSDNYNKFTSLPDEIGDLESLTSFIIYGGFEGADIPSAIGRLTNLTTLQIQQSGFVSIPDEIGNLKNIKSLSWPNNKFKAIPKGIGDMTGLTTLSLYNNELEGSIPEEIGKLTNLGTLQLYNNKLSGSIEMLSKLPALSLLYLENNRFDGNIDFDWSGTRLSTLRLQNNQLKGNIPVSLFNLTTLRELNLSGNQLTGELPAKVSWDINEKFKTVLLQNNQLSGPLPEWLRYMSLSTLNLENNNFTGSIPILFGTGINNFKISSARLNLNGNRLSGEIPESILIELKTGKRDDYWFIVDQQEGYGFSNWDYSK